MVLGEGEGDVCEVGRDARVQADAKDGGAGGEAVPGADEVILAGDDLGLRSALTEVSLELA